MHRKQSIGEGMRGTANQGLAGTYKKSFRAMQGQLLCGAQEGTTTCLQGRRTLAPWTEQCLAGTGEQEEFLAGW